MKRALLLCAIFVCVMAQSAVAQVGIGNNGTLKGKVFGDYYWMSQNHREDLEGQNGFWIRRIYLTYEHDLGDSFSSRLRFEMNSPGDFINNAKMTPVVKDAYVKWSNDQHSIYAGIAGTPTWGLVEDVWGYRSLEKSPLDLQDFGSSRDFGLLFKGKFGKFGYEYMVGNGNSNGAELNKGKKYMLALSYQLTDELIVQGYGDYNVLENDRYYYTGQVFMGYNSDTFTLGALYAHQYRENTAPSTDVDQDIASIFAHFDILENWRGVLRVDHMFDPNPEGESIDYLPFSNRAESTFLITAVDYSLNENVHIMPNLEYVFYGESVLGGTPDADIMPRITVYYSF